MNKQLITENFVFDILKPRRADSHKGTYGTLTCICGSECFPGAAALSVTSALRCGAGIVRLASVREVCRSVSYKVSEPIYLTLAQLENGAIDGRSAVSDAALEAALSTSRGCLVGCGLTQSDGLFALVEHIVTSVDCPLVLDADALNLIAANADPSQLLPNARHTPILTPHIGEMARLTGLDGSKCKQNREAVASEYAKRWNAVVVLKDNVTCAASPDGRVMINTTGNAGLARGGSGDTLAGMISAFVTQGIDALEAAACAVWLHGAAADRCAKRLSQYGMLPSDILTDLCDLYAEHGL